MKIQYIVFIIIVLLNSFLAFSDENVPKKPVELGLQVVEIDHQKYLTLNFKNYPEWHTYWKNPGDAGLTIETKFYLNNKEINLESAEWPIPQKFVEPGDQWAFGYSGEFSIFYKLDKNFQTKNFGKSLNLKSKWLVCKNICVPGSVETNFKISRNGVEISNNDLMKDLETSVLSDRFSKLPKAKSTPDYLLINLYKGKDEKSLELRYIVKNVTDSSLLKKANLFYPFPQKPFDFTHEQIIVNKNDITAIVPISWDGEYQTPPESLNPNGKFKKPYLLKFLFNDPLTKEIYVVEKKFSQYELNKSEIVLPTEANSEKKNEKLNSIQATNTSNSSLYYYLVLAFFGGLILNIMPCVLPVISLKLFGLIKYQQESKSRILKHNIFYTLGILSTFLSLALIIVSLKSFGTIVGWGFQLQSPNFIAIMIIGLFIFSLNLFGLFEFITPGGSKLGNVQTGDNFGGDFLGGVLATILSTPCSAPFLGTALTFAFTSNTFTIISIFLLIGLGLASPFIITAIFPGLVSFLPKPGNWMNTLKKLLGVTLVLTVFWLLDVYNTLVSGQNHLIKLFTILLLIFVGIFLQKKEKWISRVAFILSILLLVNIFNTELIKTNEGDSALILDKRAKGLNWEAWTESKMEEFKTNRQAVFIDFTAKWCFTCKVNEKLVLDTDEFKNFAKETNLKLLIGDWTKRDEVIGNFLMKNKMVGVPAYFIQKADGTLINLGETVSIDRIKSNL